MSRMSRSRCCNPASVPHRSSARRCRPRACAWRQRSARPRSERCGDRALSKYRGQPRELTPQPPTYVVAHTADLAPADEVAGNDAAGTSYTAAAQALAAHLAAHPDQRGRFKIVAPHELSRVA